MEGCGKVTEKWWWNVKTEEGCRGVKKERKYEGLVRRRADQDVPLVGVVFSVFLLQNQEQLLKQEHVSLSSFLPHLTHSLYQEMKCFHGNQTVSVYPYTKLTTPLCTFRTGWVLLPWQQGKHTYLMQEVTIGAQVPSGLHIVMCVWERAYELIQTTCIDTLYRMWKSVILYTLLW